MLEIGLSSNGIGESFFKGCADAGIKQAEISVSWDEYSAIDYKQTEKLAKEYDINLWSYHLPFWPFKEIDSSSLDKDIKAYTVKYLSELIKKAGDIGINKYIIHPSAEPIGDDIRQDRMNSAKETLSILSDVAEQSGGVIAVEDLPRTCLGKNSDEILELISADERLRVCFDTNHLLSENPVEFVKKVGKKIISLHVSDYDFINERHWLPGEGKVDWATLYNELIKCGYNGPWLYEISLESPETILRGKDLTYKDFVNNATEIFNGKKPTALGKPNI